MTAIVTDQDADADISILIVAYQSSAFICDCIGSIVEHTHDARCEILLIDNGTDGSAELVAETYPQVRIVPGAGNIGFGPGNNRLAAGARAGKLLLLNPDTRLVDPAIDRLLDFSRAMPKVAAWGGRTISKHGPIDSGNHIAIPTLGALALAIIGLRFLLPESGLPDDATEAGRVDVLCGGFMMVRRDVWDALGGFDESFFLYSEEVDLFTRLRDAGHEAWVTPSSTIVHDVGSGDPLGAGRILYKTIGEAHYFRKHAGKVAREIAGLLIWLTAMQRWMRGVLLGWRSSRMAAMRRAYWPIVRHPGSWWRGYRNTPGRSP